MYGICRFSPFETHIPLLWFTPWRFGSHVPTRRLQEDGVRYLSRGHRLRCFCTSPGPAPPALMWRDSRTKVPSYTTKPFHSCSTHGLDKGMVPYSLTRIGRYTMSVYCGKYNPPPQPRRGVASSEGIGGQSWNLEQDKLINVKEKNKRRKIKGKI